MASPNTLKLRAEQAKLKPTVEVVAGTELLPVYRPVTKIKPGVLGVPRRVEERTLIGYRRLGDPHVNPAKDDRRKASRARRARAMKRGA